ncbi:hypothetical protein [Pseudobutyrivibrio sp.]
MNSEIKSDYFQWLCDMVHIDQIDKSYWILAKDLFGIEFYSLVEHDENRGYDGLELRDEYMSELGFPNYITIGGGCTVLEMLVALARRIDFETSNPYDENATDQTAFWFWEMIDNLGLLIFDDDDYAENGGYYHVENIVSKWLNRDYSESGYGGIFPLNVYFNDQREVEIWYQMSAYLAEKMAS